MHMNIEFSRLTKHAGGMNDLVELSQDHPGFLDSEYRKRRNKIASVALNYQSNTPIPYVSYSEQEHDVWNQVLTTLSPLHDRFACSEILHLKEITPFTLEQIPQLQDINIRLHPLAGFRLEPVAGLVSPRTFLKYLGRKIFLSTQYIRHHSKPFYTPEPDIIHELIGHVATLAHPGIAEINRLLGLASDIASESEMQRLSNLYWYTLEFGLVQENNEVKAFGAGLLSSVKELQHCFSITAREWNLEDISNTPYDPTCLQQTFFIAPSFTRLLTDLSAWLRTGAWRDKE
jgi:phenylalanine-4-hydroxylase